MTLPMDHVALTREEFTKRFEAQPRTFYAPGRVNLIGEHTDYNQGFVMPAAIEFGTWVAIAPRDDNKLVLVSLEFNDKKEYDLDDPSHERQRHWTDYPRGVALTLKRAGYKIGGANLVVHGNVPIGAGLSSSASVEVASALALLRASSLDVSPKELALLCQRAENEFVGARCGVMDQFISVHGHAGNAIQLDCRSLDFELIPIPEGISLVICNSMIKHNLAAGEYNARRAECEEGVRLLQRSRPEIRSLRDVSLAELERNRSVLPDVIYWRCHHVITENGRVQAAGDALRAGDLGAVKKLMAESHRSLRDDYEVSCAELDVLVEAASSLDGVVGSRMTGGGFGGCTINLVLSEVVQETCSRIASRYQKSTGIDSQIYVSVAAGGAAEVTADGALVGSA